MLDLAQCYVCVVMLVQGRISAGACADQGFWSQGWIAVSFMIDLPQCNLQSTVRHPIHEYLRDCNQARHHAQSPSVRCRADWGGMFRG